MTDIQSFAKAIKISSIKKLICDVNYQANWKRLLLSNPILRRHLVTKKNHYQSWLALL